MQKQNYIIATLLDITSNFKFDLLRRNYKIRLAYQTHKRH